MNFINIELEQALIGALFFNNPALAEIDTTENDFCPAHGTIYAQMVKTFSERGEFKVLDFADWKQGDNDFEYISALANAAVTCNLSQIKEYAFRLRELTRKREIWNAMEDAKIALQSKSSAEVSAELTSRVTERINNKMIVSGVEVYNLIREDLSKPPECTPTKIECLDLGMGGGLYQGFTYGLCGAEKAGKTTLASTISYNLDKAGCKHLYIAMEMGAKQIEQRNIARQLGVNSIMFLKNPGHMAHAIAGARPSSNTVYLDAPGATTDEIVYAISVSILKNKIRGAIVDYWQLIQGQQRGETEEKHLRQAAQILADFGRRHKIWIILLAQMNKEGQLFGGNGLRKACDQLYMIKDCGENNPYGRWLQMDASRYTIKGDIGAEQSAALMLNTSSGPYFEST